MQSYQVFFIFIFIFCYALVAELILFIFNKYHNKQNEENENNFIVGFLIFLLIWCGPYLFVRAGFLTPKDIQDNKKLSEAYNWNEFDFNDLTKRPKKCGKYLICRKDGKIHWETWNGSGWAYNHNEIRYFSEINNPIKK